MTISLKMQIEEVSRELVKRSDVYPRMVRQGKMKQGQADYLIDRMKAVRDTLEWLARNETAIREYVSTRRADAQNQSAT